MNSNDKEKYEKPIISIIELNNDDIVTCSEPYEEIDEDPWD